MEIFIDIEGLEFEKNPMYIVPYPDIENNTETNIETIKECRICLDSSDENDNKLLSICECNGSMKYIHKECALKWIKERNGNTTCELCKTKYDREKLELIEVTTFCNKLYYCYRTLMLIAPFIIVLLVLFVLLMRW